MNNLPEIKRLSDGAINTYFYQQKARAIRSDAAYVGVFSIVKLISRKIKPRESNRVISH